MIFADKLVQLRKKSGWSQEELAEQMDVTRHEERETGSVVNMEAVNPMEFARVAEPEFQYGAEAFEAYERGNKEKAADTLAKEASKSSVAKSR